MLTAVQVTILDHAQLRKSESLHSTDLGTMSLSINFARFGIGMQSCAYSARLRQECKQQNASGANAQRQLLTS